MGREVVHEKNKYAVRETVSDEGILTPWFDTKAELAKHLSEHGDSWENEPIPLQVAEKFVEMGFVPSMGIIGKYMLKTYQLADPEYYFKGGK